MKKKIEESKGKLLQITCVGQKKRKKKERRRERRKHERRSSKNKKREEKQVFQGIIRNPITCDARYFLNLNYPLCLSTTCKNKNKNHAQISFFYLKKK
jgi:hypothetical protein